MICKKCGNNVADTDKFCNVCGEPNNVETPVNNSEPTYEPPVLQNSFTSAPVYQEEPKSTKSKGKKIGVIIIVLLLLAALGVGAYLLFSSKNSKMECKSKEGNITITYNKKELVGYKNDKLTFDFNEANDKAKQDGVEEYLKNFNQWFSENTTGYCYKDGKKLDRVVTKEEENKPDKTKTIGSNNVGYVDVPEDWKEYNGKTEIVDEVVQYALDSTYVVILSAFDVGYTADQYSNIYVDKQKADTTITNLNKESVKIGKGKIYNTYRVSMFNTSTNKYIYTYWFDAEDGKVHFVSIEGPEKYNDVLLTDFVFVPESFRMEK